MSGGWNGTTATATCTVVAGTDVTAENVSNGDNVKVTFDANGVPTSITWGTATYDTFTAQ